MKSSYSGLWIAVLSGRLGLEMYAVWSIIIALLAFLKHSLDILNAIFFGSLNDSFSATLLSRSTIYSLLGAGTLTLTTRDLSGAMTLLRLSHKKMILQFYIYFSIVLLNPDYASLVSLSTSWSTTTLKGCCVSVSPPILRLTELAISLMS